MRILILFFLFTIFLTENAYGQTAAPTNLPGAQPPSQRVMQRRKRSRGRSVEKRDPTPAAKSARRSNYMRPRLPLYSVTAEIHALRPEITDDTLFHDSEAVQSSRFTIRSIYAQRGFDYSEADTALLHGWKQLRVKELEPNASLSRETLVKYVSGLGKLIIRSTPVGAAVEVDGDKLPDKTEAVAWPSAGTRRIRLSMDGYEPVEDTCAVEEGKLALFERTLKLVKRKSEGQRKRLSSQKKTSP